MRRLALASLLLAVPLLAGCLGDAGPAVRQAAGPTETLPAPANVTFGDPVEITPDGRYGYEPSIQVGPEGTIYVTAHKDSLLHEGDRLASWFWYSTDDGSTWQDMPSPGDVDDLGWAFEGSIAIDGQNRVYWMDTYAVDNTLHRWQGGADGPTWGMSRPVHGTANVLDDRPWLAAHGDGIVYYIANNGVPPTAPNEDPGEGSRYWFFRSTDAGMTWSAPYGFTDSGWCTPAASPADDRTVLVTCDRGSGTFGGDGEIVAYLSTDRGSTWNDTVVAPLEDGLTDGYPSAAFDDAGNAYVAWPDGDLGGDGRTRVRVGVGVNGTWTTHDVTPFAGSFEEVWASAGTEGRLAVAFYGTNDTQPGGDAAWYPYAVVTDDATAADPTWHVRRLTDEPVVESGNAPDDFMQVAVGPDDRVHVAFERTGMQSSTDDPTHPTHSGEVGNLFHVGQVSGPGLG